MTKAILKVIAAALLVSATAVAQTNSSATFVSGDQIHTAINELQSQTKGVSFRIVDVGDAHVGVAMQNRLKAEPSKTGGPIMHSDVTEVYIVTAGSATLATGGIMTDQKPMKNTAEEGIGPGFGGMVAKANDVRPIKAGDVVIIPKNTPHWFVEIPETLTYLVVRIDPSKSTSLK